jgi:hypothetical protein
MKIRIRGRDRRKRKFCSGSFVEEKDGRRKKLFTGEI